MQEKRYMKIVEIFDSIDGEGIRAGLPVTFIRLAGCNLRCSYCDTAYALFGEAEPCEYTEMTIEIVTEKVNPRFNRVTLTGGEPLIHENCDILVNHLLEKGIEVNIETNGAVDIAEFSAKIADTSNMFYTIDYKLPSSGMADKMLWNNFLNLHPKDVIKFVVGSDEDMDLTIQIVKKLQNVYDVMPHIFIGAVFGQYDLQKLTETILKEPSLSDARLQIQLHKVIWDPNQRGV